MIITLFDAIAEAPVLIAAIKSFILWLSGHIHAAEKRKQSDVEQLAIEQAKKDKNTSGLDHLLDPKKPSDEIQK